MFYFYFYFFTCVFLDSLSTFCLLFKIKCVEFMLLTVLFHASGVRSPSLGPGGRAPFQRAMSVDGKMGGAGGAAGRRSAPCPMPIKQESLDGQRMMGTPGDNFPGNMGVCPRGVGTSKLI